MRRSAHILAWHLPILLLAPFQARANVHEHDNDASLSRFVSRPELRAPRWTVNITEPDLISPGYWFIAPFEHIDQREPEPGFVGPHIYDSNGELVWSGVELVKNWHAIDFRISNVRGRDMITYEIQREGNGYVLDPETLEIQEKIDLGILGVNFNSHEFHFVDDGTRALSIFEDRRLATPEEAATVEWEKDCRMLFNGFREYDTETWEPVFEWNAADHIGLDESTLLDGGIEHGVERGCNDGWGWDYVHLNSVDKDQNGDFYVSARHADTIYKVSAFDGHVMWRLHGYRHQYGDFEMGDLSFSRQHNVRFRGFNGTHEFISILDNAKGQDKQTPSHDFSRGLMIALETGAEPMTASLVSSIDHPLGPGSYAPRRGNYQILGNDNIFMGWSEQATHSEHAPDGRLLMEATLQSEWLGTYRSYKFPFVGRPQSPPDAVSEAFPSKSRNSTTTMVHVSWNGATDVDSWNLYKTTETGEPKIKVFSKKKTGFETALAWDGFASYVVVEAIDREGKSLGNTSIIQTIAPPATAMSGAVADEVFWLQELHGENDAWNKESPYPASVRPRTKEGAVLLFLFGIVSAVAVLALVWVASLLGWLSRSSGKLLFPQRYDSLAGRERDEEERFLREKGSLGSFHDSESSSSTF